MEIIRGTTPKIEINVKSDVDLSTVTQVWIYITQLGQIVIDKVITDVTIDAAAKKITLQLSQADTLKLKSALLATFQIRLLLNSGIALATVATDVSVIEVYKGGVITNA